MREELAELNARLATVEKAAALLPARLPRVVRDEVLRESWARALDALLRDLSCGYHALDLAICEGLHALDVGSRTMDLGYSNVGDYAREELGMPASTACKMKRLGRRLKELSVVREAVRSGELTLRKAEIIARVARAEDEVQWVLYGKASTCRALQARAAQTCGGPEEDRWVEFCSEVPPDQRPTIDEGLRIAGIVLGAVSSKMQRVEAWGQEYMASHVVPEERPFEDVHFSCADDVDSQKEFLEEQSRRWASLVHVEPLRGLQFGNEIDPWRIDAHLKRLVEVRSRWDEVFGKVALLFQRTGCDDALEFRNFGHYCEERLGMAERTVAQRVALERALERMPALRQAMREKRISYEKARVIARHAQSEEEVLAGIAKAEATTCIDLREALQEESEAQMCARGQFNVWLTVSVAEVVKGAIRAACARARRWLSAGECVVRMAEHFAQVWKAHLGRIATTLHRRILRRDRYRCQVPGCSRPAKHVHHLEYRAHGGDDDPANLISLCAAHHLRGIHDGLMRVTGTAPGELVWEFGLRRPQAPRNAAFT